MQTYANLETVYQVAFPASQAGKLSDVWYTVNRLDETGAPIPYFVKNQDGVIETGSGVYAVNLILGEGRYNIFWEITNTQYTATEEINVLRNIYDDIDNISANWTGYGAGDRQGVRINNPINLQFNLLRNGRFYNAYSIKRVEIYSSYTDAQASTNIVETISSSSISHPSLGLYTYQATYFSAIGTKFDKVIFELEQGQPEYGFINPFYIREASYTPPGTGELQTVRVYLNVFDIIAGSQRYDKVEVIMNAPYAWYDKTLIKKVKKSFSVALDGSVYMDLIPTDLLTSYTYPETGTTDLIYYNINVCNKLFVAVTVPSTVTEIELKDLIDSYSVT